MMTCHHLAELLIDYVAGELPPEQCDHIRKHLCECPPCVAYLQTYELTIKLSRQLPPVPLPPKLVDRLRTALADYGQGGAQAQA
jgi:anti-sigma factor RsiW